jgi:hypothetical protein
MYRLHYLRFQRNLSSRSPLVNSLLSYFSFIDDVLFSTGIGGWQTVSVKTIDDEKEREEHEAAVEAMRQENDLEVSCDCVVYFVYMIVLDTECYCNRV